MNSLIVWEVCECSLVVSHKHAGRIHGNRHKHTQTLEDDRVACSKCVVHVLLMRTQFSEATCQKAPFKYSFGHARVWFYLTPQSESVKQTGHGNIRLAKLGVVAYLLMRGHRSVFG